mmetsp:Transcript_86377/g.249503  ORF Transcript_86377/g.249503 Transcript_86377/m.249503 type:complete len:305 (+) Transcript_86377:347-1261(+)
MVPVPHQPGQGRACHLADNVPPGVAHRSLFCSELGDLQHGVPVSLDRVHADAQTDFHCFHLLVVSHFRDGAIRMGTDGDMHSRSDFRRALGEGGGAYERHRLWDSDACDRLRELEGVVVGCAAQRVAVGPLHDGVDYEFVSRRCPKPHHRRCGFAARHHLAPFPGDAHSSGDAGHLADMPLQLRHGVLAAVISPSVDKALRDNDLRLRKAHQGCHRRHHGRCLAAGPHLAAAVGQLPAANCYCLHVVADSSLPLRLSRTQLVRGPRDAHDFQGPGRRARRLIRALVAIGPSLHARCGRTVLRRC